MRWVSTWGLTTAWGGGALSPRDTDRAGEGEGQGASGGRAAAAEGGGLDPYTVEFYIKRLKQVDTV